ncbi:hypothetical protein TTHERM_00411549 (macronuclear) [Tetrahymena thermophila SB210]|uniref:Uncharacterized protein n=1 Tax=Tetrahymena thermophila (strain SB210) TaxID=312017 RepID=A4VDA5_TETTS|nr:hypothetical protein TTHERM_00411549 [Tetrahymena thermophila SB210]EDK31513.2 hypothetical protein TTHERM_00411549 [Tetrahymena thermophila SB210]|eukprot:XP_001470921.2 hypothetical protein TTHERM_00411549 [Tetrahymena thermophila SB210]
MKSFFQKNERKYLRKKSALVQDYMLAGIGVVSIGLFCNYYNNKLNPPDPEEDTDQTEVLQKIGIKDLYQNKILNALRVDFIINYLKINHNNNSRPKEDRSICKKNKLKNQKKNIMKRKQKCFKKIIQKNEDGFKQFNLQKYQLKLHFYLLMNFCKNVQAKQINKPISNISKKLLFKNNFQPTFKQIFKENHSIYKFTELQNCKSKLFFQEINLF